jgi:hypothetical protein
LYRVRSLPEYVRGNIVRAETATQLYRDTKLGYSDLISFEEDIARIATIVLVIAESPGSLAELGAFASNETIRRALRIIIQTSHSIDESFIRYGPVERIKNDGANSAEGFVGVYPWRTRKTGKVIVSSAKSHHSQIVRFINSHLDAAQRSEPFPNDLALRRFYVIYWIVYLAMAITTRSLVNLVRSLISTISEQEVLNAIYCMKIAGWIDSEEYSSQKYYFVCWDKDPFLYSFNALVGNKDSVREKAAVSKALLKAEDPPMHIRKVASRRRTSP